MGHGKLWIYDSMRIWHGFISHQIKQIHVGVQRSVGQILTHLNGDIVGIATYHLIHVITGIQQIFTQNTLTRVIQVEIYWSRIRKNNNCSSSVISGCSARLVCIGLTTNRALFTIHWIIMETIERFGWLNIHIILGFFLGIPLRIARFSVYRCCDSMVQRLSKTLLH